MKVAFSTPTPVEKMKTFPFKKKEWPDEDNKLKMKIDNPAGGVAFSEQMQVLSGKEHPELFLLWLQDFRAKIWTNKNLTWPKKLDILLRIVEDDASTVVQRTINRCQGSTDAANVPNKLTYQFQNWEISRRIHQFTDNEWLTYIAFGGEYQKDQIKECIHALKFEIYRVDMASCNSYYKLRCQIRGMKINFTDGVRKWAQRIEDYQSYLPDMLWESSEKNGKQMVPFDETDMREILDSAMTKVHLAQLLNVDWNHHEKPYTESIAKLESLEPQIIRHNEHEKRLSALEGTKPTRPQGKNSYEKKMNPERKSETNAYKKCKICGKTHKGKCWHTPTGDGKPRPQETEKDRKRKRYKEMVSVVKEIMESKEDSDESDIEEWKKLTKDSVERAYVLGAAQTDQNYYDSDISIDSDTTKQYLKRFRKANKKKRKTRKWESPLSPSPLTERYSDVVVEITDSQGRGHALRGLLDSGCSRTIILKQFTNTCTRGKSIWYQTYGSTMTSSEESIVTMKLIEFSSNKTITFPCQVDLTTTSESAPYDIILGSDFMEALGIDLQYSSHTITWDACTIPLKPAGTLVDETICEAIYYAHTQPPLLQAMEQRQHQILDADYSKVDLDSMVDELEISLGSKSKLKQTLKKFPTLFGGGLGLLDINPVTIELQNDARPFNGRYYSTPKAFELPFKKEIKRMCDTNILRKLSHDDDSPWASPSFAQPKKTGDIRVLTDFRKMNAAIERKLFPLLRIGETIQRLKKFISVTALDLSQGYYSIPICRKS